MMNGQMELAGTKVKKLYGVITAMTTPFTKGGAVDAEAIEQQVEFLIEKGVNCLYPCGTTGEMYLMSEEERMLVAQTVVKKAAGRVTVYIHCGAMSQEETIRLAQHAHRIGADGVGVVTPSYFGVSARMMVAYYRAVSQSLPPDFPMYIYVIPQLAANDIAAAAMEEIAVACPNVIGVKYSFANMRRLVEYLQVRNGNFSVVFGPDDLFFPALAMGADGTVSGCSSCLPEWFVAVYKAYLAGDYPKARELQFLATKLAKIVRGGADMSVFKNVQTMRGVRGGYMKAPLLDLLPDEVEALRLQLTPYLDL